MRRTVVTIDRDFLYYSEITAKDSYGAIVISTGNATPHHINDICKKALSRISTEKVKGAYVRITAKKITYFKGGKKQEIPY